MPTSLKRFARGWFRAVIPATVLIGRFFCRPSEPDYDPDMPMADEWKRADYSGMRFEKRPGSDWCVDVLIISEDEVYPVTVFGAEDEAAAIRDALSSFSLSTDDLRVTAVGKIDD